MPLFSISENYMNRIYIFLNFMLINATIHCSTLQFTENLLYFFLVIENMKKTQPQK